MIWTLQLAIRYARRNPAQTMLLATAIAVTLSIPVASRMIVHRFDSRMTAQADAVPVIVGPRGSRFDLVLASVFYRPPPGRTISMADAERLETVEGATVIPLNTLFTARGRRLVCTEHEFFDVLGFEVAEGTLPLWVGDVVLGSGAARELGIGIGDSVASDRHELFDLTVPPPIALTVTGVLAPTGTSADDVIFASMHTAWLVGGQSHAHDEAEELESDDLIAAAGHAVTVKPTLDTETTVTQENVLSIHGHQSSDQLPLTAVLVFADDAKPLTLASARFEGHESIQAVRPRAVINEMMQTVVRVQGVFDSVVGVLAIATVLLVALTTSLAAKLRGKSLRSSRVSAHLSTSAARS